MSNARKLQTEIDRVMKKVDEGVELFDETWEKVYNAESQNQKEKYEADLKKEIKKLQRLRDQIKTWIGSSDVKDKEPLVQARKLVETKMEQFKVCEKETKTKTYSKEGLARADKLDPVEEAKLATAAWIQEYIERLQEVVEETDFEIERLSSGKGKKSNKHQIETLQEHIANHRFHVSKLEGIIRLVNNDHLDVEPVDQLREDIDYYLDSYKEEDYQQAYDSEYFYESLGLDELDVVNVDHVTLAAVAQASAGGGGKKSGDNDAASMSSKGSSKDRKGSKKSALASVIPLTIGRARTSSTKEKLQEEAAAAAALASANIITAAAANNNNGKAGTPSKVSRSSSMASSSGSGNGGGSASKAAAAVPPVAAVIPQAEAGTSMAAVLKRETEQQEKERQKLLREQQAKAQAEQQRQQEALKRQQDALRQQQEAQQLQQQQEALQRQQQQQQEALRQQQEAAAKQQQAAAQLQAQQQQQQQAAADQKAQQKQLQNQQQQQIQVQQQGAIGQRQQQPQQQQSSGLDMLSSGLGGLNLAGAAESRTDPGSVPIGAGAGSNNPAGGGAPNAAYGTALDESFATTPNAADQDRNRQYTPQNPYPTPASYPSTPSAIFENPAVFEKLGTDCLFFIFYYAQGTYQQYLAARELKKQSWRFHRKYMTWFQRHEEPKVTTDEYEQGTYVYFDYETGWCTRIKTDFRFEYSFLEDS